MKIVKTLLWLLFFAALFILGCRPVVQDEPPVAEPPQQIPAQVATPTPTPTTTPTPTLTPSPAPTPSPTPQATPRPGMFIPTPVPIPPGVDMSPPKPPSKLPPPVGTVKVVETELTGPSTKGGKVYLGGAFPIQLPPDAYIERIITTVDCAPGLSCPPTPYYGIRRGKSRFAFSAGNGEVLLEEIAQGEFGAFDFFQGLTRKTPSPTTAPPTTMPSPAVTGPASKGASIEVAGKGVKLPDNAYIDAFIVSIYCRDLCPKTPLYRIAVSDKSWVEVSSIDGKIWDEWTDPKEFFIWESLKKFLNLNLK